MCKSTFAHATMARQAGGRLDAGRCLLPVSFDITLGASLALASFALYCWRVVPCQALAHLVGFLSDSTIKTYL